MLLAACQLAVSRRMLLALSWQMHSAKSNELEPSMGRKRLVSKKDIDARYWRNVEIQDCFWRDSFIGFIRPLRMLYRDPMSAGAHILSAYLADPINAKLEFTGSPDAFGALRDEADLARAKDTYEELVTGRSGPTLQRCAEQFEEQREASAAIAKFADELPKLYWELQNERAVRNSRRTHVRIEFFGKSIYVEQRIKVRMKRKPKVTLKSFMS